MRAEAGPGAPEMVLCLSNLNLPPADIALAGVSRHREILAELNGGDNPLLFAGGFDVTPTRRLALDSLLGKFEPTNVASGQRSQPIASRAHQTWARSYIAGTFSPKRERSFGGMMINHKGYTVMPETRRSLETVSRIGRQLGGNAVICAYPDTSDDFGQFGRHVATQVQSTSFTALGGRIRYRTYHDALWRKGIKGLIIDNHHILAGGLPAMDILDQAEATGTTILGLHAAAARIDANNVTDRQRSLQEFDALLAGPEALGKTAMGKILARAHGIAVDQRTSGGYLPKARYEEVAVSSEKSVVANATTMEELMDAHARNPLRQQLRAESIYRTGDFAETQAKAVPVTLEVPHAGMAEHQKAKRQSMTRADFVSMTRDAGQSLTAFFENPNAYVQAA